MNARAVNDTDPDHAGEGSAPCSVSSCLHPAEAALRIATSPHPPRSQALRARSQLRRMCGAGIASPDGLVGLETALGGGGVSPTRAPGQEANMRQRWIAIMIPGVAALTIGGCAGTYWSGSATVEESSSGHVYAEAGPDYFYDALAPYGAWADIEPYGWVWCPLDVPVGWRPYTVGYWSYTDYGWMWSAEDPWGPIPYHYGRWAFDASIGWLWVP